MAPFRGPLLLLRVTRCQDRIFPLFRQSACGQPGGGTRLAADTVPPGVFQKAGRLLCSRSSASGASGTSILSAPQLLMLPAVHPPPAFCLLADICAVCIHAAWPWEALVQARLQSCAGVRCTEAWPAAFCAVFLPSVTCAMAGTDQDCRRLPTSVRRRKRSDTTLGLRLVLQGTAPCAHVSAHASLP